MRHADELGSGVLLQLSGKHNFICFHKVPSAYASGHGSGHSGWTKTSLMCILSFHIFALILENVFKFSFAHLVKNNQHSVDHPQNLSF